MLWKVSLIANQNTRPKDFSYKPTAGGLKPPAIFVFIMNYRRAFIFIFVLLDFICAKGEKLSKFFAMSASKIAQ